MKIAKTGKYDMIRLPDSYAFFAYAVWLATVKDPDELNKPLYDWSSGIAKY